jgi:hypothetical protein
VVEIDDYDPDREVERERYYDRCEIQHKERLAMARAAAQVRDIRGRWMLDTMKGTAAKKGAVGGYSQGMCCVDSQSAAALQALVALALM